MKKVHLIGIAGQLCASLAVAFQKMGWQVTGSDQPQVYPPVSDFLALHKINYSAGYQSQNITSDLNLVIVGGSAFHYDQNNPEVKRARELSLKIMTQAEAVKKYVIKKNSIVVAGTYGKTTITAMVANILCAGGYNPSFMFGGMTKDLSEPLKITDSVWSVVEGDEYPTLGMTQKAKFLFYRPLYLLLTAARWEHQDVYKSETEYLKPFTKLVSLLPKDGLLVANRNGGNIEPLIREATCPVVTYTTEKQTNADWWAEKISYSPMGSVFEVVSKAGERIIINLKVLGEHNIQNAVGVVALCCSLGIDQKAITAGLSGFRGLQRRLELVGNFKKINIVRDISQTKPRVIAALSALKKHFPDQKIMVIFYPNYTGFRYRESLSDFPGMFDQADEVLITRVIFQKNIPPEERVLGKDILCEVQKTQPNASYVPDDDECVNKLTRQLGPNSVTVFMSSGNYREIDNKVIRFIEKGEQN